MFKGQGRGGLSRGGISFLSLEATPSDCFTSRETLCVLWQGLLLATRGLHQFIPNCVGKPWESCLLENYCSLKTSSPASPAHGVAGQGPRGDYSLNNQVFPPGSLHGSPSPHPVPLYRGKNLIKGMQGQRDLEKSEKGSLKNAT